MADQSNVNIGEAKAKQWEILKQNNTQCQVFVALWVVTITENKIFYLYSVRYFEQIPKILDLGLRKSYILCRLIRTFSALNKIL